MKKVVAVAPYNHGVNFKMQAYNAWVKIGGETMPSHYPWRLFHRFAYNYELPTIPKNNDIAQLRFVEPISLSFDTFPIMHDMKLFHWCGIVGQYILKRLACGLLNMM